MSEQPTSPEAQKAHEVPKKAPEASSTAEPSHFSADELEAKKAQEAAKTQKEIDAVKGNLVTEHDALNKENEKDVEEGGHGIGNGSVETVEEKGKGEIEKEEKKVEKKSTGVLKTGLAGAALGIGYALGAPVRGIAHFFHGVQEWLDHYVESQKKKMTLTSIAKDIGNWFASIFKMGGGGGGGHH